MVERGHSNTQEQKRWEMYKELKPAMQMKIESNKLERFGICCGVVVGAIVTSPTLCILLTWGAKHNDDFWDTTVHTVENFVENLITK